MDFISWLFTLIGFGSERAMHQSNRQAEAFKLAAEVSSEAGRAMDIINAAMPRLTRRCAQVCGDNPQMCNDMVKILAVKLKRPVVAGAHDLRISRAMQKCISEELEARGIELYIPSRQMRT